MTQLVSPRCARCGVGVDGIVPRGWMVVCAACQRPDEWMRQQREDLEEFGEPEDA